MLHFILPSVLLPFFSPRLCSLITACHMSLRQIVMYESSCRVMSYSIRIQFFVDHFLSPAFWHIPIFERLELYASFFNFFLFFSLMLTAFWVLSYV